jgi:hypothetical protein
LSEKPSDQDLVRQVLDGNSTAFDRLMKRLEPNLVSFLRGRLRDARHVDVQDVLQDVRLYLFQRLDRYNPAYPVDVFARGLAGNVAKRFVYGKRDVLEDLGGDDAEESSSSDLSPLELQDLPLSMKEVLGVGRFESPEGSEPPSRIFLELFEVFLRYGGYPHQQVAFGYSVLLWGKEKAAKRGGPPHERRASMPAEKVPVTGDPDRVVREVAPKELTPSSKEMLEEIASSCRVDGDFLARVRKPLDERLAMTGASLFARDVASFQRFQALAGRTIGTTELREYFGSDPRKSVSEWTHAVKNRVKRAFEDPESRSRIPLPEFSQDPPRSPARAPY